MKNGNYISWVASAKGVLILLIVFGHVIGGAEGMDLPSGWHHLWRIIYLFHVPAFFVLVGLLMKNDSTETLREFIKKKFVRLMVPYFVFGVISILVYCVVVEKSISKIGIYLASLAQGSGWGGCFKSNSVLWFLPVMFTSVVVYGAFDRFVPWRRFHYVHFILFVPIAFYLYRALLEGSSLVILLPWGCVLSLKYIGYIVIGRCCQSLVMCQGDEKRVSRRLTPLCAFLFCVVMMYYADSLHDARYLSNYVWCYMLYFNSALASVSAIMLFRLLDCGWLAAVGRCSLCIMLVHKFFVVFLQTKIRLFADLIGYGDGVPAILLVFGIAVGASYGVTLVMMRTVPEFIGQRRQVS